MSRAAGITVFGYGAPETDQEAIELLKKAANISQMKDIAPFTIINLKSCEKDQRLKWKGFYDVKMTMFCEKFEDSILWKCPRVSLETIFDTILQQHPRAQNKSFSKFNNLKQLQEYVMTIDDFEMHM